MKARNTLKARQKDLSFEKSGFYFLVWKCAKPPQALLIPFPAPGKGDVQALTEGAVEASSSTGRGPMPEGPGPRGMVVAATPTVEELLAPSYSTLLSDA